MKITIEGTPEEIKNTLNDMRVEGRVDGNIIVQKIEYHLQRSTLDKLTH